MGYKQLIKSCIIVFATGLSAVACQSPEEATSVRKSTLETIGLYAFDAAEEEHYVFWKACGYNFLQFIDKGLWLSPEEQDGYYERLARGIEDAQRHGFKVGILLQSNVLSHPHDWWETFDPRDSMQMQARLATIEAVVKRCRKADVMEFYAGDPGGAPDSLGAEGIALWKDMAQEVRHLVHQYAPTAMFNVNIWAVSHWDYIQISPWATFFWDKEVQYGREIAGDTSLVNPMTGIEFPLHNYYRSLAFKAYEEAGVDPERFPTADGIRALKQRGIERIWGWAHFLIDEVDDGYTGYAGTKTHPAQAETRYLHRIVSDARQIGLTGMISNCDGSNSAVEAMNVYAFARFCQDGDLTPEKVIDEYASYLGADTTSQEVIAQVIRFIENHSTWEQSLPERNRVAAFTCRFETAGAALDALERIPHHSSQTKQFPLLESPAEYLIRLKDRLRDIAALNPDVSSPSSTQR